MVETDILVIGLGAIGSAALYHLARRGAAPMGLDQFQIDHPFGSSYGRSRAFRIFYHEPLYVNLATAALPLWQELEAVSGEALLTLNGMLMFARPGNEAFERNLRMLQLLRQPYEQLTAADVASRFPAFRLPADWIACLTPGAGFLDASGSVRTHVTQARRFGASVREQVRVRQIDIASTQPEIETSAGRYRCARLILTAGPWTSQLLADLALPLTVTRQQKFYFKPKNTAGYQPDRLPIFADYEMLYYGFPDQGQGLKVADDNLGDSTTPDALDRNLDLTQRDRLQQWLRQIMPDSDPAFIEGQTCMYTLTPDRDFVIGSHPGNPNVLIGAGFSGHGFKFSTLIGRILAELALDGTTGYPIDRFNVGRFIK